MLEELTQISVYKKIFKDYVLTKEIVEQYVSESNRQNRFCILVYEEDIPVGIGVFDILPWLYSDVEVRIARLSYIYVRSEYRGKGYGREIQESFEYWGKKVKANFYSTGIKTPGYKECETIYMKEVK